MLNDACEMMKRFAATMRHLHSQARSAAAEKAK